LPLLLQKMSTTSGSAKVIHTHIYIYIYNANKEI
jgi:hypothetical protein